MTPRVVVSSLAVLVATASLAQSPIEGVLQDLAGNEAQREIGRVVEIICPSGQITDEALQSRCNEIVGNAFEGNAEGVRASLQALAPEENLVVGSSLVDPSVAQVDLVRQRLATIRAGAGSGSTFALNFGPGPSGFESGSSLGSGPARPGSHWGSSPTGMLSSLNPALATRQDPTSNDPIDVEGRWGFFANATSSSAERDPTSRVSGFDSDQQGFTAGLDYRVTSRFVLGGAVGYEQDESDLDLDGGSVDNETLNVSVQASWFSGRTAWFEAIGGIGMSDIDQSRAIRYSLPGVVVNSVARGTTESDQTFLSLATGWDLAPGAFAISPEIRLDYLSSDVDAFSETVTGDLGRGLGIAYDDQDFESLTGQVGVQIGYNVSTSFGVVVPQLNASLVREFEDGADRVSGGFLGDSSGESYVLLDDEADESYGQVGVGAVFVFRSGRSFYVFYDRMVSHEYLDVETFNVGLRLGL